MREKPSLGSAVDHNLSLTPAIAKKFTHVFLGEHPGETQIACDLGLEQSILPQVCIKAICRLRNLWDIKVLIIEEWRTPIQTEAELWSVCEFILTWLCYHTTLVIE